MRETYFYYFLKNLKDANAKRSLIKYKKLLTVKIFLAIGYNKMFGFQRGCPLKKITLFKSLESTSFAFSSERTYLRVTARQPPIVFSADFVLYQILAKLLSGY
jgi:hypothetical protein